MSNAEATKLYEYIIEEVISDSRQDFEDSGIDESTLQELRRIWCDKLSQSGVAKFSWDDEENQIQQHQLLHNNHPHTDTGVPPQEEEDPGVVMEQNELAYATNNDITLGLGLKVESSENGLQIPTIMSSDDTGGLMLPNLSQTDGTFEMTVHAENGDAKRMWTELKRRNRTLQTRLLKQNDGADDDDDDDDSDIFNDSDDINSDLDEGLESEKSDDEDADQEGQIMLCLYDKVQRVKNKWKSNLKEGVANINGRDYVFQKATGECEW